MTRVPAQGPSGHQAGHLVLYDGVCRLCNRSVQFVLERDRRAAFQFASLQSATGQSMVARYGHRTEDLTTFYVVANFRSSGAHFYAKSDAALFVLHELGWPWKGLLIARMCPRAIRDLAYDVIARTRYRVFGRYDQCVMPRPEFRDRFIDEGRV